MLQNVINLGAKYNLFRCPVSFLFSQYTLAGCSKSSSAIFLSPFMISVSLFLKGLKSNIESGKAEDEIAKLQFDIDIADKRKSQRKELKDLDALKDADGLTPKQQLRWDELDRIKPALRRKQKIGFLNNNR